MSREREVLSQFENEVTTQQEAVLREEQMLREQDVEARAQIQGFSQQELSSLKQLNEVGVGSLCIEIEFSPEPST